MNKENADKIISEYMKKIYGFALTETKDIDLAEELAAIITFEVYKALLKAENIFNVNSYIYRIAQNVYSRFITEEKKHSQILPIPKNIVQSENFTRDKDLESIRKQISYLSKLQREIVFMYYFEKMSKKDIANRLNVNYTKVKWHLNEARNQIKEGFNERTERAHVPKQVVFSACLSVGNIGMSFNDTSFYLKKDICQSIIYSVHAEPKSIQEIAKELLIPYAYVEDEVSRLLENGFINKVSREKYLSNVYIIKRNKEIESDITSLFEKYAKIVCELYIQNIFKIVKEKIFTSPYYPLSSIDSEPSGKFYTPLNDKNFLMWSLISCVCLNKLITRDTLSDKDVFKVKRKYGGNYIALALLGNGLSSYADYNQGYSTFEQNSISREIYPFKTWNFFSKYDEKNNKDLRWTEMLYETLYDFMIGKIKKEASNIDKFMRLYENGLLVSNSSPRNKLSDDFINIIMTSKTKIELLNMFPPLPKELINIGSELDELLFKTHKKRIPAHQHDLCRLLNQNSLSNGNMCILILENLLRKGLLKPIKKNQKKSLNTIMFINYDL